MMKEESTRAKEPFLVSLGLIFTLPAVLGLRAFFGHLLRYHSLTREDLKAWIVFPNLAEHAGILGILRRVHRKYHTPDHIWFIYALNIGMIQL